ncbi:hypothetical protein [Neolewinella antarctica]|uniref:Uncharacterized protein n=1 Tax=Neolewinella antarctica TaxID=442734 RepID=A0ABX0XAJ3_9BACT|nr:hypothetical protein [Neolewinella antarctica]NJC26304.1 hypothetical protein [Neolewinella antarctica]
MEPGAIIAILFCVVPLLYLLFYVIRSQQVANETQRDVSDADLIKLIHDQPDQLLSPHQLASFTGITVNQARHRLTAFNTAGMLTMSYNKRGRYFYALKQAYRDPAQVSFSPDPFLTVEDLLQLFAANDNRANIQDIILATRLPLQILKRELKHFEKEGFIQQLTASSTQELEGGKMAKFYVLQEPYRSEPHRFRERAGTLDLELKQLLKKENLIV